MYSDTEMNLTLVSDPPITKTNVKINGNYLIQNGLKKQKIGFIYTHKSNPFRE